MAMRIQSARLPVPVPCVTLTRAGHAHRAHHTTVCNIVHASQCLCRAPWRCASTVCAAMCLCRESRLPSHVSVWPCATEARTLSTHPFWTEMYGLCGGPWPGGIIRNGVAFPLSPTGQCWVGACAPGHITSSATLTSRGRGERRTGVFRRRLGANGPPPRRLGAICVTDMGRDARAICVVPQARVLSRLFLPATDSTLLLIAGPGQAFAPQHGIEVRTPWPWFAVRFQPRRAMPMASH